MKIIALDFDGVLNGDEFLEGRELSPRRPEFDPDCCERVQRICTVTGASLVISSSWRGIRYDDHGNELPEGLPRPLNQVRGWLLDAGITATVVGCTGLEARHMDVKESRALQILDWVQEAGGMVGGWCALDDFRLTRLLGRGIQTHWRYGIREVDVEKAVGMLGVRS